MARARQDRIHAPGQLTLDDWAEVLRASDKAAETPPTATTQVEPPAGSAPPRASIVTRVCGGAGTKSAAGRHPVAAELLEMPGALLTRTHPRELGLERRAVDAVFRALPVVALPGYSRPMIRADQYLELVQRSIYDDDRVRPMARLVS